MVDPRFGRSRYFIIADPATQAFDVVENEAATQSGGFGIQAAQNIVNAGANAVVTGNLGPNAAKVLAAVGLKVCRGTSGTVGQILR